MPKVAYGARLDAVYQSAGHVLFVEGDDERSFDPSVLQMFFQTHRLGSLQVRPLRGSFHVRAAAEALHPGHPSYYFLIHVIVSVREDLKKNWIETFDAVTGFETYDKALEQLKRRSEFSKKKKADARALDPTRLEARLEDACDLFLAGDKLEAGRGCWMERMNGKLLFRQIIPPCFEVRDNAGRKLGGKDKEIAVVEDLLRLPLSEQPPDFQELHRLMTTAMR